MSKRGSIAHVGPYTAIEVDTIVKNLEDNAAKMLACAGKMIKLRAQEMSTLKEAEMASRLLKRAMKGDKQHLALIFGANNCERIGRLRIVIDSVEFKDSISANDARWKEMETAVETIEIILKDLGSFKPYVPGATPPPESLKYKALRRRVSPRRAINLKADLAGGACTFSVEGALPPGLLLDAETGTLSGAVMEPIDAAFTIIAKNDAGEIREEVAFQIADPPPVGLSYPELTGMLTVGEQHVFSPVLEGGYGRAWKIEPALPEGFELNESSGAILGAAGSVIEPREYKVTTTNAGGSTECTFSFGASLPPPVGLSYPALGEELAVGRSVALDPELESGFPTAFSVNPPLPEGLSIDEKTGCIRGAPAVAADAADYVVTASNDTGEVKAILNFACVSSAPTSLAYPGVSESYTNAALISLHPQVAGGTPDTYAVDPELPAGLVFSKITGSIDGVPQGTCDKGTWTVTATNASGAVTCELSFAVTRAPPQNLVYPSLEPTYAVGRAISFFPTVEGDVDEFSVDPPLPGGLAVDAKSGIISGTPSASADMCDYQVTAKNDQGSTMATVAFALEVLAPHDLAYPSADKLYHIGETVGPLLPEIDGGADSWKVYPELPAGIILDLATGIISGSPTQVTENQFYTVTGSNEGGSASFDLELQVDPCAPKSLAYPSLGEGGCVVEEPVDAMPVIDPEGAFTWTVDPTLPPGLQLDSKTGRIAGTPEKETEVTVYRITAQNVAGSVNCDLSLFVEEMMEEAIINVKFAQEIEECDDIAVLLEKAPPKESRFGDWMIWMVHRAHLNDPTLVDFNFTHCKMPLPHEEYRVGPKLMKALETNTHIERLVLCHANMQKPQGHELADALRKNTTITQFNIEGNHLDSSCMLSLAKAIGENTSAKLAEVRLAYQQGMGASGSFGNAVEQAFGEMISKNQTICTLGISCDQPHWRDTITRALLMNNDRARRARKQQSPQELFNELPCEDKTLALILLTTPPSAAASELLVDDGAGITAFKKFVADSTKLPTATQLQSKAKSEGVSIKFSDLKPTMDLCRSQLLNAAKTTGICVTDTFNTTLEGTLMEWEFKGHVWAFQMLDQSGEKRYKFTSQKEPSIAVSESWSKWLKGE